MEPSHPKLSKHPVGAVFSVGPEGTSQVRRLYCQRRQATVEEEECLRCPAFVRAQWNAATRERSVQCHDDVPDDCESGPLTLPRIPVSQLMTRDVLCVRPELSLDAALALFLEHGFDSAPVVDAQGALLGFVTQSDVQLDVHARLRDVADVGKQRTVGDVILPYPLALAEHTPVTCAAGVMAYEGLSRLAVVSNEGVVVGLLAASDVMAWLARADGYAVPLRRVTR